MKSENCTEMPSDQNTLDEMLSMNLIETYSVDMLLLQQKKRPNIPKNPISTTNFII